jgi:hypothetical protein
VVYSPFLASSRVQKSIYEMDFSVPGDSMTMMAGSEDLQLTADSNHNGGLIYFTFRIFYPSELKEVKVK